MQQIKVKYSTLISQQLFGNISIHLIQWKVTGGWSLPLLSWSKSRVHAAVYTHMLCKILERNSFIVLNEIYNNFYVFA